MQLTAPQLPSNWAVKDVIAHLRAWQQVSIARLEAALNNGEPEFPDWLAGLQPESEEHLEQFNVRIYEANRDQLRNPNRIFPGQILTAPTQKP